MIDTEKVSPLRFMRPVSKQFPDGTPFGVFGDSWGYHFEPDGKWVKGKVDHLGKFQGQHGGRDIACPVGTLVCSPSDGKVIYAGWQDYIDQKRGYGICCLIQIDKEMIVTLGHFSEIHVNVGDYLREGNPIGLSGNTGNTTGPHLHMQVELPGNYPRIPLNFEWKGA